MKHFLKCLLSYDIAKKFQKTLYFNFLLSLHAILKNSKLFMGLLSAFLMLPNI